LRFDPRRGAFINYEETIERQEEYRHHDRHDRETAKVPSRLLTKGCDYSVT
jgi:hypothetical protein